MVKKGDVIRGYRIAGTPGNTDAGKCLWTSAEKGGEEFFVKEFLDPRRPRPGFMGSPEARLAIDARCDRFEMRHQSVNDRIDPAHLHAGNLVTPIDFFSAGSRYYKVTKWVRPAEAADPRTFTPYRKSVLLGTLGDSVGYLHSLGIVHGDLKPQNVLVHRPDGSDLHTAKLIDFDDAFLTGQPPEPTVIGGDPRYGAPEWIRYVRGEIGPEQLTTAVDMFALGLLVHTYVVGRLPGFDRRHGSPGEAVNAGDPLAFDERLDRGLLALLYDLVYSSPGARPGIDAVREIWDDVERLELKGPPPRTVPADRPTGQHSRSVESNAAGSADRAPSPKARGRDTGRRPSRVRINIAGSTPTAEEAEKQ